MTVAVEAFIWAIENACSVCLMMNCKCNESPLEGKIEPITAMPERKQTLNLEDIDGAVDSIDKQVMQRKAGNVTTKWVTQGALRTVKPGSKLEPVEPTEHSVMLKKVRAWAATLPEDTEEVVGNAMLKYAELLVSHPGKMPNYYFKSIKNDRIDRSRKRKVEEVTMEEMPEDQYEAYESVYAEEAMNEWFLGLTRYGKQAVVEAIDHVTTQETAVPERIKRRLRKIDTRPNFKGDH